MGKILPILLIIIGVGGGIGAGLALRPDPAATVEINPCGDGELHAAAVTDDHAEPDPEPAPDTAEYVKLSNQFVVPVVTEERISALVVMSLSLEIEPGAQEGVYRQEPKLRDVFLQVLFDHANTGGFDGAFTSGVNMNALRKALLEVAKKTLGASVHDVLIVDVVRQDA